MSDVFKIINATKEEACRTAEAEAIRVKTGETESLTYDFANGKGFADAIESISSGTEITDGIVVKARDANGYATEIDFYGDAVRNHQFYCYNGANGAWQQLTTVNFKNTVTEVKEKGFYRCVMLLNVPPNLISIGNDGLNGIGATSINLPELVTAGNSAFNSCGSLVSVILPKCSTYGTYSFGGDTSLLSVEIGSIGFPVTVLGSTVFNACTQAGLSITAYCKGPYANTLLTNIRTKATNATIIIKASEDTTYGGNSYLAGETIITSTPT